jgi:ATP-dependent DNA ligase
MRRLYKKARFVTIMFVIGYVGGMSCRPTLKTTLSSLLQATRRPIFCPAMKINPLPAGFVIPAQPVPRSKPPSGADWVHEIKHDGYRIIVCRDGTTVRLYSRNAYDWTLRLAGIAAAAERIKAKSFTIDGEAVVLGPDGLSRFEELSRREAARTAVLYAFDLIEYDGEDLRNLTIPGPKGCAGAPVARCQGRYPAERAHR